jgi:hypothetical protein
VTIATRPAIPNSMRPSWQAAQKGPSATLARSRGAAAYVLSTPRTSPRAPPCIWTFLSSLVEIGFPNILLGAELVGLS